MDALATGEIATGPVYHERGRRRGGGHCSGIPSPQRRAAHHWGAAARAQAPHYHARYAGLRQWGCAPGDDSSLMLMLVTPRSRNGRPSSGYLWRSRITALDPGREMASIQANHPLSPGGAQLTDRPQAASLATRQENLGSHTIPHPRRKGTREGNAATRCPGLEAQEAVSMFMLLRKFWTHSRLMASCRVTPSSISG